MGTGKKNLQFSMGVGAMGGGLCRSFLLLLFQCPLLFQSLAESIIVKSKEKWGGGFLQQTIFSLPTIMWD